MAAGSKTFFHVNIKFLREKFGLTQAALCDQLKIDRNKLQALESGRTVNPIMADLISFSSFFNVSIDDLVKVNMREANEVSFLKGKKLIEDYISGESIRVLAISVNIENIENIEYVPIKAKAGYNTGFSDPEFIASLPKLTLPNIPSSGTFRVFPTIGTSMFPIPENSDIICEYVVNWRDLKPNTPCVVILNGQQDFVFKLVTIQEKGTILLKSLNPEFKPYEVMCTDVLEIWKYFKHQTGELPRGMTVMDELKELIQELNMKIEKKL